VHTLSQEDFHNKDTSKAVKITLCFGGLSEQAQKDFEHYVRQGKLIVFAEAEWDEQAGCAQVLQFGSRLVMEEFAKYFEAVDNKAKVAELQPIFQKIRDHFPDLPEASTKKDMTAALRDYEEKHPVLCRLVEDDNQFYGWSKGVNLLARHVQWVYVPAVKDASSEQDEAGKTALGQLLKRTIRTKVDFEGDLRELRALVESRYEAIVNGNKEVLADLQDSIETRLKAWASPRARLLLNWHYEADKTFSINEPAARASIGDASFIGEVARLGHGMQRGFVVALLQELALSQPESSPTLLLGFEEPELYQHPPQAQHLASLLERMCEDGDSNTQVLVTTHSPYFVSGRGFESVRLLRKDADGATQVAHSTFGKMEARLADALQEPPKSQTSLMARVQQIMQPSQNELFFTKLAVLVEGPEDIAYIGTYMQLSDRWEEFRKRGCHFVIAEGKGNMSRLAAIALELEIPLFLVFDADAHTRNQDALGDHEKNNACLLRLMGAEDQDPLPPDHVWRDNLVMWQSEIGVVVSEDFGTDKWLAAKDFVKRERGFDRTVRKKNALLISATMQEVWDRGARSSILDRLCDAILAKAPLA